MTQPAGFSPTLSSRFAVYVRDYLMDRGVNPDSVFEPCGVDLPRGEDQDMPIPVAKVARLFRRASAETNNPVMGLSMGKAFHYESSSLLIIAMLSAENVREGLRFLAKYDRYFDSGITAEFSPEKVPAEFSPNLLQDSSEDVAQINEYLVAFLVQTLFTATRTPMPLLEVAFSHPPPEDASPHAEFFKTQVRFGAKANGIKFHPGYLDEPFLSRNKLLFTILSRAIDSYFSLGSDGNGFVDTVCREIMVDTGNFNSDAAVIADRLRMSPRTLRRRLADEGHTFRDAKRQAREQRAKYLLVNSNFSLSEIAFELGYSELSAFSRAFRAWTGEAPQAYRESARHLTTSQVPSPSLDR
ncbi:transcriptional regulator, AraC family [Luminiphilus syltensis NOR5-1B]|uniref:Transcriptional regulator, AraC family n=1 Tax=Luminiphilus syltensis NOR5-1B TaxID=565045 RepID=B8KT68_9GAMM|nr:AraC family transcriptional regulator [Luminiphilus syltensis]EED34607.1 transcriptional regulator, AraC family [Luminiphilus syltensis NOR5-1B]